MTLCFCCDCEDGLIVSLGSVADKEQEEPERLSRAGSYRASLRYYTKHKSNHASA